MAKSPTKSSGIRMPVKIYGWVDRLAAREDMSRSECVCKLMEVAAKKLASKPKPNPEPRSMPEPNPKPSWTVNAAWAGYFVTSAVIGSFITVVIQKILTV